jgi:uracil-DNA glycosylase family 4
MLLHPLACTSCPLQFKGAGFVQPAGPPDSPILLLGESPGIREAETSEPFMGPSGGELNRLLWRIGKDRRDLRKHNTISCRPPHDKLERMPWEYAVDHCRPHHLSPLLSNPALRVIVTLGGVPTRAMLETGGNLKDFHGTVTQISLPGRDSSSPLWVVPTFHPAHLIRGAKNLTATVLFDLSRAFDVAENGWEPDLPTLHLDPPPDFVRAWVDEYLAAVSQDPAFIWLSVDVETADKERKLDEGELKSVDKSMEITRVNLSCRLDEGLTFPAREPYMEILGDALKSAGPKWFWNKAYDLKRLWSVFGVENLRGALLDGMDAWHALHSDVPKGLGFVSPFYSRMGAWKHLSHSRPAFYAACDSVQNQRCVFGVAADLQSQGMWDVFWRHMHEVDRIALAPSCRVGLKLNPEKLEVMRVELKAKSEGFFSEMQGLVADDQKALHPKDGWTRRPEGAEYVWPPADDPKRSWRSRARPILSFPTTADVKVCEACGQEGVAAKHRCKGENGKPVKGENPARLTVRSLSVSRYFIREDFNPGSWQQVLAYIKSCGHKPGHEKGKETTNRETIERLAESVPKSQRDERARDLYRLILDFREVKKIQGTYVEGMLARLAESGDGRVHPVVTNNPSTLRTAYNSPNLQNVVADKRGKASLASGFRQAIEAEVEEEEVSVSSNVS